MKKIHYSCGALHQSISQFHSPVTSPHSRVQSPESSFYNYSPQPLNVPCHTHELGIVLKSWGTKYQHRKYHYIGGINIMHVLISTGLPDLGGGASVAYASSCRNTVGSCWFFQILPCIVPSVELV